MTCPQCQSGHSPANARFCVKCGYILLQNCPNPDCNHAGLPVRRERPVIKCPTCKRFLLFCPGCFRLTTIETPVCPTSRCKEVKQRPVEWYEPDDGRPGGEAHILGLPWEIARPIPFECGLSAPHEGALAGCYGLAFRYGQCVAVFGDTLYAAPMPAWHQGSVWPSPGTVREVALQDFVPSESSDLMPPPHALHLAHANAYLLGRGTPIRISLERDQEMGPDRFKLRAPGALSDGLELLEELEPAPVEWNPREVEWIAQASSRTHWYGIAEFGGRLVGTRAFGQEAHFEGEVWPIPEINPMDWRGLLIWRDQPVLVTSQGCWREEKGGWEIWRGGPRPGSTVQGMIVQDNGFWLWGLDTAPERRLWAQRHIFRDPDDYIDAGAELGFEIGDTERSFVPPVAFEDKVVFFRHGSRHSIVILDESRPFELPHEQSFPAGQIVFWSSGARHLASNSSTLLFVTFDGTHSHWFLMPLEPYPGPPSEIIKLRALPDLGGTVAATLAGISLIFVDVNEKEFRMRGVQLSATAAQTPAPSG